jgi:site-specific DNA recombinase
LEPARREAARLELEIATAESVTNVIELHPQAVQRFKENIDALADILTTKDGLPDLDLISTFRSLVERVVVHLRNAGRNIGLAFKAIWLALWVQKCRLYQW